MFLECSKQFMRNKKRNTRIEKPLAARGHASGSQRQRETAPSRLFSETEKKAPDGL
jgi:hypothetical protein